MNYLVNSIQERYKHWKRIEQKIVRHDVARSLIVFENSIYLESEGEFEEITIPRRISS